MSALRSQRIESVNELLLRPRDAHVTGHMREVLDSVIAVTALEYGDPNRVELRIKDVRPMPRRLHQVWQQVLELCRVSKVLAGIIEVQSCSCDAQPYARLAIQLVGERASLIKPLRMRLRRFHQLYL